MDKWISSKLGGLWDMRQHSIYVGMVVVVCIL